MKVKTLIEILQSVNDKTLEVKVLAQDGVEELPFVSGQPIVFVENSNTPHAFVSISVVVES